MNWPASRNRTLAAAALACCLGTSQALAATYRPQVQLRADRVRLSDLFSGLPVSKDGEIGPAPALGESFVVGNAQLEAIAAQYEIDWTDPSPAAQVLVTRATRTIDRTEMIMLLSRAMVDRGIADNVRIIITSFPPVLIPGEEDQEPTLQSLNVSSGKAQSFTAVYSIPRPPGADILIRVSGKLDAPGHIVALRHTVHGGEMLSADNLVVSDCGAQDVPANAIQSSEEALGLVARHAIPAGQALVSDALERQEIVRKGAPVVIVFSSNNLRVTASGIAVEGGGRGDIIHVLNPIAKMMIMAEVRSPSEVEVVAGSSPTPADDRNITALAHARSASAF